MADRPERPHEPDTPEQRDDPDDGVGKSEAPLLEHLTELRWRLIKSVLAVCVGFGVSYVFADFVFNLLLAPYQRAVGSGSEIELIYTAPQEYFLTQIKLALFGGIFISFPYVAAQVYMFAAPGLYRNERRAVLPFLVAAPVLFVAGCSCVYFVIMPLALRFFHAMEQSAAPGQAAIVMVPRVSEYLGLTTTLMFAFGLCFQLPVLLSLLARAGIVSVRGLRRGRKYAIVGAFVVAAFLTPPDLISQVGLAIPTIVLYEFSILTARLAEGRRARAEAARAADDASDADDGGREPG